jgi:hypothetical protein
LYVGQENGIVVDAHEFGQWIFQADTVLITQHTRNVDHSAHCRHTSLNGRVN